MPDVQLYYVHDPMCSWCYAFSKSLSALQKTLSPEIPLISKLGGLAADSNQPMPENLQNSIQQAWQHIENTVSHIQFNYDFWAINTPIRSTYPACRALLAARKQNAEFEKKMLWAIQHAYYQQARNPSLTLTLEQCAEEVGLDKQAFIQDLNSPDIQNELLAEINFSRSIGVSSYPSLRLVLYGQRIPIRTDYLNHQTMIDEISAVIEIGPTSLGTL